VFLNSADGDDVRSIVKLLSEKAKEHKRFRAFVYFLNGSPKQLKKLNDELQSDSIALALIPKSDVKDPEALRDQHESEEHGIGLQRAFDHAQRCELQWRGL
jgi:hypothetical protein